jgi:hypothetical protein
MNRSFNFQLLLRNTALKRGVIFGGILFMALMAFEVFNFSTTQFALLDMLGDLKFAGMRWATVLAIAFCGMDFAGIARIFTPEQGRDEPAEVWYLFGAWLLAAAFNAMLTWWGVSVAILNHTTAGGALLGQATMTKVVPIFVACTVWLIRVLIISTFSVAGERLFTLDDARPVQRTTTQPVTASQPRTNNIPASAYLRPAPKPTPVYNNNPRPAVRPEPSYHPVGVNAQARSENNSIRS